MVFRRGWFSGGVLLVEDVLSLVCARLMELPLRGISVVSAARSVHDLGYRGFRQVGASGMTPEGVSIYLEGI